METGVTIATEAAGEVAEAVVSHGMSTGEALINAILGYAVVFIGLALLMLVIIIAGKIIVSREKKATVKPASAVIPAPAAAPSAPAAPAVARRLAPGSAGEVKLYDTDPRDAALIMAIVAEKLGKPLNELRFVSIKEVK